jgi:hypothetical protein
VIKKIFLTSLLTAIFGSTGFFLYFFNVKSPSIQIKTNQTMIKIFLHGAFYSEKGITINKNTKYKQIYLKYANIDICDTKILLKN